MYIYSFMTIILQSVSITLYLNGDTEDDRKWLKQFCTARKNGFSFGTTVPTTFKVGADIVSDIFEEKKNE